MTIEKGSQGQWIISDVVNGYLFKRVYFFYTKREAIREFKADKKTA